MVHRIEIVFDVALDEVSEPHPCAGAGCARPPWRATGPDGRRNWPPTCVDRGPGSGYVPARFGRSGRRCSVSPVTASRPLASGSLPGAAGPVHIRPRSTGGGYRASRSPASTANRPRVTPSPPGPPAFRRTRCQAASRTVGSIRRSNTPSSGKGGALREGGSLRRMGPIVEPIRDDGRDDKVGQLERGQLTDCDPSGFHEPVDKEGKRGTITVFATC